MRSDVRQELIQNQMEVVLEAVKAAEKSRREIMKRAGRDVSPSGVDLRHIQYELYNEDNSVTLTVLEDTIARDRLNRLLLEGKLFREKLGREVIYFTPETWDARQDYKKALAQKKIDREDRVEKLSADLGCPVNWYINAPFRSRQETVVISIEDLEAIARHIEHVEAQ